MNLNELTEKAIRARDLYSEYEKKKLYKPWTSKETYLGLVSDVGDLGRLVLAKEGFRESPELKESLSHELGEILYATLVLAEAYNIDLEQAFTDEMNRLDKSLSE